MAKKVIIIGAGLSGSLISYFMIKKNRDIDLLILERSESYNEEQTWSFHWSDLDFSVGLDHIEKAWVRLFCTKTWSGYHVFFDEFHRQLALEYCSIRSKDFYSQVRKYLLPLTKFNEEVIEFSGHSVKTKNHVYEADLVIDARGISETNFSDLKDQYGFQKFIGLNIKTERPHSVKLPILMDATVNQKNGYRFFYLLPWSDDELLVEDTYYHLGQDWNESEIVENIHEYIKNKISQSYSVLSMEKGVLPIPLRNRLSMSNAFSSEYNLLRVGIGAGFYHPTTSYSLFMALIMAKLISDNIHLSTQDLSDVLEKNFLSNIGINNYYCFLNRMLFLGAEPNERVRVFSHFYKKNENSISRFYSASSNWLDRLNLLSGKPPISPFKAVRSIWG